MKYVFGTSVQQADAYARANSLDGARTYGPDSRLVGVLFTAADTVYIMPGIPERLYLEVERTIKKNQSRPTLEVLA